MKKIQKSVIAGLIAVAAVYSFWQSKISELKVEQKRIEVNIQHIEERIKAWSDTSPWKKVEYHAEVLISSGKKISQKQKKNIPIASSTRDDEVEKKIQVAEVDVNFIVKTIVMFEENLQLFLQEASKVPKKLAEIEAELKKATGSSSNLNVLVNSISVYRFQIQQRRSGTISMSDTLEGDIKLLDYHIQELRSNPYADFFNYLLDIKADLTSLHEEVKELADLQRELDIPLAQVQQRIMGVLEGLPE